MTGGAIFSRCRTWRYLLWRLWEPENESRIVFIGLNPSTADETEDDPTIRRCRGFAQAWGYGGMHMLNLFALRSTNPKALYAHDDPVGPENDRYLRDHVAMAELSVAAWGTHGALKGRANDVMNLLDPGLTGRLFCFGVTAKGYPKHPLYLPRDTQLMAYTPAAR